MSRRYSKRPLVLQLLPAVLALAAGVAHARLPSATDDHWLEVRSQRFTVCTNFDERAATAAARHLERLAQVLEQTAHGLRTDSTRDVRVYLFRDEDSFMPYCPFSNSKNFNMYGFQVSTSDVDLIAYHTPSAEMRFASHEYIHAVLRRNLGPLPVWINEGLAEYYSTFETDARSADIGRPIPEHLAYLEDNPLIPLTSLMALDVNSRDYHEGERRGTIYAQSWALVHMMVTSRGPGAGRFHQLLVALGNGTPSTSALRAIYGPNAVDSIQTALGNYVHHVQFAYMSYRFNTAFVDEPVRVRPLDRTETLTLLGELAACSKPGLSLGREHLEAAWQASPVGGLAAAVLCVMADRQSDGAARLHWAQAVEKAPNADPRARALAGATLAMQPFRARYLPSWPAKGPDSTARIARHLLEQANGARPGRPDWLIPYGLTFVDDSTDFSAGIRALMTAHEAEPQRADAAAGLSMLMTQAGNRAGALQFYQQVRTNDEDARTWKRWAAYLLAMATMKTALDEYAAGHAALADTLLVALRRDVDDPEVTPRVDKLLAHVRGARSGSSAGGEFDPYPASGFGPAAGGESDRPPPGSYFNTPIPRAMAMAKAGDYAGAEKLLEQTARDYPESNADVTLIIVRNLRRAKEAQDLIRQGRAPEACALYEKIMSDSPQPDVASYVRRQQDRFCSKKP